MAQIDLTGQPKKFRAVRKITQTARALQAKYAQVAGQLDEALDDAKEELGTVGGITEGDLADLAAGGAGLRIVGKVLYWGEAAP